MALTAECPYSLVREMLLSINQPKFEYLSNVILDLVLTRKFFIIVYYYV